MDFTDSHGKETVVKESLLRGHFLACMKHCRGCTGRMLTCRGVMGWMIEARWMATSIGTGLGDLAVFSGFDREELQAVVGDWRLELAPALDTGAECYQIVREPWSDEAKAVCVNARAKRAAKRPVAGTEPDGLIHLQCGHEDALVGSGGVVWIAPGRRLARVAITPDRDDPFALEALLGAALTHAMALLGCLPLHGMAAEVDGIGVLALGDSMAGKSTLALAMLHAGGHIVSDDFLLAQFKDGRLVVSALRQDLYVREGSFELIPAELGPLFSSNDAGLGRMKLSRNLAPQAFINEVSPQVIWFLDGTRRSAKLFVIEFSQAEAFRSLLQIGSPLFISNRYNAEKSAVLPQIVHIVQSARNFSVQTGSNLFKSPSSVIQRLLKEIE
jgi:hypothetical protein